MELLDSMLTAVWQLVDFIVRAAVIGVVVAAVVVVVIRSVRKPRADHGSADSRVRFAVLNSRYAALERQLSEVATHADKQAEVHPSQRRRRWPFFGKKRKTDATADTDTAAAKDTTDAPLPLAQRPRLFVLDFKGDLKATDAGTLGTRTTAILLSAKEGDEVLCVVTSPGGVVDGYGLCASQLQRFKAAGIKLTVAIDTVAASGGYMMAAVANQILAAPFAYVGSIGVVLTAPNFHRLVTDNKVDVEMLTSADNKRNLTLFGENTDAHRAQAQEQIDSIHAQFVSHVAEHREKAGATVDWDKAGSGAHWTAQNALAMGLVDAIDTSANWVMQRRHSHTIILVDYAEQPTDKLRAMLGVALHAGWGWLTKVRA